MSSYPPGGDYDERLLDNAPKTTKAERQEGYNVNLLASDSSETPMNPRPQPTVDGHTTLEAGALPDKETYTPSFPVPWYRQGKWRAIMLIGGIIVIGAVVGGAVGGTVSHNNKNTKSTGNGPSATLSVSSPGADTSLVAPAKPTDGPLLSSSTPSPQTTTGAAVPTSNNSRNPQANSNNPNGVVDMGTIPAAVVALVD